jgi:hypothetical protein
MRQLRTDIFLAKQGYPLCVDPRRHAEGATPVIFLNARLNAESDS